LVINLGVVRANYNKRSKLIDYKEFFIAEAAIYINLSFYNTLSSLSSFYLFVFFTCIKKTNKKKVQPFTWSRILRDFPVLLGKAWRCKTRHFLASSFRQVKEDGINLKGYYSFFESTKFLNTI
jgi:hypothetical protein